MSPSSRTDFAHLNALQNQTGNGERKKKHKRDYRKMWVDADKAFFEARDSLSITREVQALITHPELKTLLNEEELQTLATQAREVAANMKAQVAKLAEIRDGHVVTRAKYPITQRRFPPMDEIMENLGIMEAYATWTEETMKLVILPCAEISETIEAAQHSKQPAEQETEEHV